MEYKKSYLDWKEKTPDETWEERAKLKAKLIVYPLVTGLIGLAAGAILGLSSPANDDCSRQKIIQESSIGDLSLLPSRYGGARANNSK